MKTVSIQIGNSDDKLSQRQWANFVLTTDLYVQAYSSQVYFFGLSKGDEVWQNACWVVGIEHDENIPILKRLLANVGKEFQQESIAWTIGETEFI